MTPEKPALRVLVVEDELLIRWSIQETLNRAGCLVMEAADGATAVRLLQATADPVDVVLLDFRLPDSNDLQLLSKIRVLTPSSPVILMTAFGTPEVFEGARRLGVSRILDKPFDIHELPGIVHDARVPS